MSEEQTPSERRLHAIVHGRVQGVNFRSYTLRKTTALELDGWVRNTPDGTVEVLAEGDSSSLEYFLEFLHTGSPSAMVSDVDVTWGEASGEFDDFQIRYFYSR